MTYRNYYLIFLASIVVSLGALLIQITGVLFELYDTVLLLDIILFGFGVYLFTTYFMTDSRASQLINVSEIKYYLMVAFVIGLINNFYFDILFVSLAIRIFLTIAFGLISIKYLNKNIQMDFVGLGITYVFFTNLIGLILLALDMLGYTLVGTFSLSIGGVAFLWIFYVGANLILLITYLILITVKGSQMPEVADYY